jgi:hypothetical protein
MTVLSPRAKCMSLVLGIVIMVKELRTLEPISPTMWQSREGCLFLACEHSTPWFSGPRPQVHFILRHQNPVTGEWEEKHAVTPPSVKVRLASCYWLTG